MISPKPLLFLCMVGSLLSTCTAREPGNWTQFRNGGNSKVEGNIPDQWQPDSITWQRELRGYGQSTPVIYENKVFVTSVVGR